MKSGNFVSAIVALIFLSFAPALCVSAEGWVDIKDPNELRALYSNKTFKGKGWVGHYRADGKGILIPAGGNPQPRTWEVKGNDEICVAPAIGVTNCYHVQRDSANPNAFKGTNVLTGQTGEFTAEKGIPRF